jgi:hypothetical protein
VGLAADVRLCYLRLVVQALADTAIVSLLLLAGLAVASAGCDRRANASTLDAGASDASAPSASSRAAPTASASASPEKQPLQLLKFVFTSDVKNKDPVDRISSAQPGQRVWVHLTLRNRGNDIRPITVFFRVNNEQRSKVDLRVEPSWSYRTFAYNTLRTSDLTGELAVEVRDDAGATITTQRLPIRPSDSGKPVPVPAKRDGFND